MNTDRRSFFRKAGALSAAPLAGLARAIGVKPTISISISKTPFVFTNGQLMTAERLNAGVAEIAKRVVEGSL